MRRIFWSARYCVPLILLPIFIAISYINIFVNTARAATTTYFPSSSNILTGSLVSGDMASLVNVDANYYTVRSASSATTTTPYTPSAYNLLGSTTLDSGAISDGRPYKKNIVLRTMAFIISMVLITSVYVAPVHAPGPKVTPSYDNLDCQ